MRLTQILIKNFRGILDGKILFEGHSVLVGDNNSGKSTVLEAIDLVLGPERLSKRPAIDEHDFYGGIYFDLTKTPVPIMVEAVIVDLTDEQQAYFRDHLEWWDSDAKAVLVGPPAEDTNKPTVIPALRVGFRGVYDEEDDDFAASTYYMSPANEDGTFDPFRTADKRQCGFLFLRTLRTGSRALSLERGSLLDIVLKLQEKRLQMWEDVLQELRKLAVAEQPELGLTSILSQVQDAIKSLVPAGWGDQPHMRVTDLTRESLRKSLTVFLATGASRVDGTPHAAPFQHQGTGTINALVLALLSMIADLKQNVIFAMEEPEIAIPPHTQRRIVDSVRRKSAQAIFTSHSPYVLEQFDPENVVVVQRNAGTLRSIAATYPPTVKPKAYREEMRGRFCECLLAPRVLVAEGRTEYDALPAAARRLHELHPTDITSLEGLGVGIVNAETDSQVAPLCQYFRNLGKTVIAVFDKQTEANRAAIEAVAHHSFECPDKGLEKLVIDQSAIGALRRYGASVVADGIWPTHLHAQTPNASRSDQEIRDAMRELFKRSKGEGCAADFLAQCSRAEMPQHIVDILARIKSAVAPKTPDPLAQGLADAAEGTPAGS
jgi:putative ATP-dependent endonuclease of the OLD family